MLQGQLVTMALPLRNRVQPASGVQSLLLFGRRSWDEMMGRVPFCSGCLARVTKWLHWGTLLLSILGERKPSFFAFRPSGRRRHLGRSPRRPPARAAGADSRPPSARAGCPKAHPSRPPMANDDVWQALATVTISASAVATGLTAVRLWRSWDVRVSSVRWLFFCFFLYLWLWSCMRCVYFVYVAAWPLNIMFKAGQDEQEAFARYSSMSIYTILQWKITDQPFVTALLCLGDSMLFASALLMMPLTFELSTIATKSMDRGVDKEKQQIKFYSWVVHGALLVFATVEAALAAAYGGYSEHTQRCLLSVYFLEFLSFFFMIWLVIRLKIIGRKYENVQGQFVTSPVYQRLKRIMYVVVHAYSEPITALTDATTSLHGQAGLRALLLPVPIRDGRHVRLPGQRGAPARPDQRQPRAVQHVGPGAVGHDHVQPDVRTAGVPLLFAQRRRDAAADALAGAGPAVAA